MTAYARVSSRSSPGVEHPRARRARANKAITTNRPGSAGNGSIAGRYQRRDEPRDEASDARSSGTANARRRRGSTRRCAHEQTLAAQLDQPSKADVKGAPAHGVATP